jgi:hypothetical protein
MFGNWGAKKENTAKSSDSSSSFGIKLPDDNKVAAVELKSIADKYKERSKKIDDHIKKASKDRELANKLAANYIHNYKVMIDISSLLNQYADFFQSIKNVLSNSDVQLEQLNAQSFQNLELLTRKEMDKFTSKFNEQAGKVKKLFEAYNMSSEAAKLNIIPQSTNEVSLLAEDAVKLRSQLPQQQYTAQQQLQPFQQQQQQQQRPAMGYPIGYPQQQQQQQQQRFGGGTFSGSQKYLRKTLIKMSNGAEQKRTRSKRGKKAGKKTEN